MGYVSNLMFLRISPVLSQPSASHHPDHYFSPHPTPALCGFITSFDDGLITSLYYPLFHILNIRIKDHTCQAFYYLFFSVRRSRDPVKPDSNQFYHPTERKSLTFSPNCRKLPGYTAPTYAEAIGYNLI